MRLGYWILIGALVALIGIMIGGALGGAAGLANVAVIPIEGPISIGGYGDLFSGDGASSTDIARWIEEADENDHIKVIVLEINSPGGAAVASDEIARAIEAADTPTVAWIREVGASGAYWAASEADYIIANRLSTTGSVGVIASYLEFGEFLNEHNITYREMTGGEYKGIGNPFDTLSDEEQEILQDKLDTVHDIFLTDVQENRNLTDEQIEEVRTGVFFLGVEALEMGLVDELGGRKEVEAYVASQLEHEPVYQRYEKPKTLAQELFGVRNVGINQGLRIQS